MLLVGRGPEVLADSSLLAVTFLDSPDLVEVTAVPRESCCV